MILVLCDYSFKIDNFNVVVANNRNSFWNGFFEIFTHIGSFYTLAILAFIAVILLWFVKKDKRMSVFYAVCFAVVCISNYVIKIIVRRARPDLMIISETGYSFPSGHSMMSFAFFMLLIHFVWITLKNKPLKISLTIIFSVLIEMIGFSRIYLGVHYLTDIIAGWLITFVLVGLCLMMYNSKLFRKKDGIKSEESN
ncbi:MAG: phosphatase PAP2 family protein [Clostridia bacterium]|nr:phosphatase PAP2 family protein [Clostridia bacterium]